MSIPLFPMHIPLCCLVLLLSSHFVRCCSNDFPFQTHPSCTRTDLACVPNDGPFRWQIIEKPWDFGGFPWSFGLSLSSLRNWWRCFTLFYLVLPYCFDLYKVLDDLYGHGSNITYEYVFGIHPLKIVVRNDLTHTHIVLSSFIQYGIYDLWYKTGQFLPSGKLT